MSEEIFNEVEEAIEYELEQIESETQKAIRFLEDLGYVIHMPWHITDVLNKYVLSDVEARTIIESAIEKNIDRINECIDEIVMDEYIMGDK